ATFEGPWREIPGESVEIPELKKAYVRAVKEAARGVFGEENVVWCMEMTPRLLFGDVGLGGDGLKRIARSSDDYFPHEPESHRYHIFTNVLNALFLNNLDVFPDFDMFQTHAYISPQSVRNDSPPGLAQGAFHALFRVFGTGPVTITGSLLVLRVLGFDAKGLDAIDTPLKSDSEILRKIVGNTSPSASSPSLVIQASHAFTVLDDVFDPAPSEGGTGKGLKVYVNSTIGVWNVRSWHGKVVDFITPPDIAQALSLPANSPLPPVILHIQSSNSSIDTRTILYGTSNPVHPAPPVRLDLHVLGWAAITVAPIEQGKEVASLGLVDKYLSSRGVEKTELKGGKYSVSVRSSGTLGVWIGAGVKIGRVGVSLVDDKGAKGAEQNVEFETEGLPKGKRIT
ncbi:hypothetical protein FRC07_014606, partial [Ceratobasidium sp. 392]